MESYHFPFLVLYDAGFLWTHHGPVRLRSLSQCGADVAWTYPEELLMVCDSGRGRACQGEAASWGRLSLSLHLRSSWFLFLAHSTLQLLFYFFSVLLSQKSKKQFCFNFVPEREFVLWFCFQWHKLAQRFIKPGWHLKRVKVCFICWINSTGGREAVGENEAVTADGFHARSAFFLLLSNMLSIWRNAFPHHSIGPLSSTFPYADIHEHIPQLAPPSSHSS